MSTYSHPTQIRRQYLVPYKPVYARPQAYHYSLPRPSNTRVNRQASNAESYTLSRPPGRAQPIRVLQQEHQPIMTRNLEDFSATHLMEYEQQRNTSSRPEPNTNTNAANFGNIAEDELIIEAALEPFTNVLAPSPPKYSRSSRTPVKDIQYQYPRDATVTNTSNGDGVEISPVQPEAGAQESEEWQEISLYVRRPSLEDVRRVRPQMTDNNPNRMRSQAVETNVHSRRVESSSRRTPSHGQKIITNTTLPPSGGQNYVYRTTIPREPQPRQKPVPMIMVNDEAMQF